MAEKMVDQVTRIMEIPEQIRNIAICAHIDHGKTTFSDNLLSGAGMMSEELAGKARQLDFHDDEAERGITIDSAAVSMVHKVEGKEFLINLIDTPGHVDFGGDVTRAMRAVDGAIVLICASEGAMPQTETVLRQALREKVKPVLFINKVDRLIKELQLTPQQMQERFVKQIAQVNNIIKGLVPADQFERWMVKVQDGTVAFGSAFHNWALSVPYMQKNGISFKDIIDAYKGEEDAYKILAKKAPLHEVVLNMVVEHHPNPKVAQGYRVPHLWQGDLESTDGKNLVNCNSDGKTFFVVTKVVVDPQAGEIAAGRLFSGRIRKGDAMSLNMVGNTSRVQQVYIYNGAKRAIVDYASAGNIIGVSGLKGAVPGETATSDGPNEPFEKISHIFDPVVSKAIEAKRPADLPKLIEVLRQVQKEDPTIKIEINEETGEHLMHGMGELHLEIIENRIKSEKGVDVKTSPPIVVYREAITKTSPEMEGKSPNKHNKLYFIVEPLEDEIVKGIQSGEMPSGRFKRKDPAVTGFLRDSVGWDAKAASNVRAVYNGNMFIDNTRGIVHINEILEMVLDTFENVMKAGPLAKDPCINMKVRLMDCKLHEDAIHRGPAQMYPAVREGIRAAVMQAGPVLYEPLQITRIEAPTDYVGEVSKLISSRRGQLLDMEQEGDINVVKARMPVGELFGWSNDLRSATGGRGNSSLISQDFEKLPMELQDKVRAQIIQRKGLSSGSLGA